MTDGERPVGAHAQHAPHEPRRDDVNRTTQADRHPLPFVSVVMPVRNEGHFIQESLGAVLHQDYPQGAFEVLVVDGDSDDETVDEVLALRDRFPDIHVRVIDNPDRKPAPALNLGIAAASGDIVVRVDGHCRVEPDYLRRCVEALDATGADCVGGPMTTVGRSHRGRAIAAAQSSHFGVGGVAFRTTEQGAYVDTVPFGAYRRPVLDKLGGFDEHIGCNEDDDLNFRLTRAGYRIWMDPTIRSTYYPREGFRALWSQYFRYGRYKVPLMAKNRAVPALRQLVPPAFVGAGLGSVVLTLLTRKLRYAVGFNALYLALNASRSRPAASVRGAEVTEVMTANTIMHTAYGCGFWLGAAELAALVARTGSLPARPGDAQVAQGAGTGDRADAAPPR